MLHDGGLVKPIMVPQDKQPCLPYSKVVYSRTRFDDIPLRNPLLGASPKPGSVTRFFCSCRRIVEGRRLSKLFFYYSTMNAGKSTNLLQASYNYQERGMRPLVLAPEMDDRFGTGKVTSRIGLQSQAIAFSTSQNLFLLVEHEHQNLQVDCVLVDEAQFLTKAQVRQLTDVCDLMKIPVLAYGLRTDFQGHLFEGSQHLMAWADNLYEIKTICHCGRKATMVLRIDADGKPVREGEQIQIGGNERYVTVCRKHFKEGLADGPTDKLPFIDL